jgi:hypothetical protein
MKVQCNCGAKYAIDVTPEMARNPVHFVCPNCNLDLSGPINDLVRQELGVTAAAPVAQLLPVGESAPAAPPAPPAHAAPAHAPMRVSYKAPSAPAAPSAPPPPAPPAAAPARLAISKGASTATHGTAVETAPQPGGTAEDGKPCPKHQGETSVGHCYICRKPICPKCMELFGYVCSPLCRAKAESNGINVPVFAGQRSVIEAQMWHKVWRISAAAGVLVCALIAVWAWWGLYASRLHSVFNVRFPEMSYAGNSRIIAKNQIVFLHGGFLARYKLGSKTPIWTNEIISKEQVEAAVDREMNGYKASLDAAIKHGADSEYRPHIPLREQLVKQMQISMEKSLQLYVHEQNVWIERRGKLTRYDWDTGKPGQEIALPSGRNEANVDGGELQFVDVNGVGQHIVTHLSLVSGEMHTETIGEPKSSAVLASTQTTRPAVAGKRGAAPKGSQTTGLPNTPGVDMDKPLDPAKVAQDAQKLPYAAKVALPATLSNAKHQNEIFKEIKEDEQQDPVMADDSEDWGSFSFFGRDPSFVRSKYGNVEWHSKLLEAKSRSRKVMKDKPAVSALESNPSVTNTAAIANEILNDMQRDRGGETESDDISRYQVTVHRADAKDVPDWVGEVIGPPSIIEQKTVTIVTGLEMFVVLDKSNKKLWEGKLAYKLGPRMGLDDNDPGQTSPGEGPVVERDDALYVCDQATLNAYDLATGNVRWRVGSIGIVGMFFDGAGSIYVNSTSGDLDTIRYSRQIDIGKKIAAEALRIDCKTGKVYWKVRPGGLISHVEGKYVFCFASHQADDLDPDSLTTMPGMLDSAMAIRRLNPKTGSIVWDYSEQRCPLSVRFNGNIVELVFRKEVEVLKFM